MPGSQTIRPPSFSSLTDASTSSVRAPGSNPTERRTSACQYPFEPPKIPKPSSRVRPGCPTEYMVSNSVPTMDVINDARLVEPLWRITHRPCTTSDPVLNQRQARAKLPGSG